MAHMKSPPRTEASWLPHSQIERLMTSAASCACTRMAQARQARDPPGFTAGISTGSTFRNLTRAESFQHFGSFRGCRPPSGQITLQAMVEHKWSPAELLVSSRHSPIQIFEPAAIYRRPGITGLPGWLTVQWLHLYLPGKPVLLPMDYGLLWGTASIEASSFGLASGLELRTTSNGLWTTLGYSRSVWFLGWPVACNSGPRLMDRAQVWGIVADCFAFLAFQADGPLVSLILHTCIYIYTYVYTGMYIYIYVYMGYRQHEG